MERAVFATKVKEITSEDRTLEFLGSTESQDRVGDIIVASGWKLENYRKNPVFLWAHDYRSLPIGKATKVWKEKGELKFRIQFADAETYEFADTAYKLYKGGFLSAVSVGFEPIEHEDIKDAEGRPTGGYKFKKQELLELSAVPVPANAEALVTARDAGVITVKEFDTCEDVWCKLINKPEEDEVVIVRATEDDPTENTYSQAQIGDELDYMKSIIEDFGLNDDNLMLLVDIARIAGADIPDEIDKAGAVLSKKNKDDLNEAKRRIDSVITSATKPEDEPREDEEEESMPKSIWDLAGVRITP